MQRTKAVPIVHIPHPALRQIAAEVSLVDTQLLELYNTLAYTLRATRNPRGVGLAAPQIAVGRRLFAIQLDGELTVYINPIITTHCKNQVLGPLGEEPQLEGCLSIPNIYGPVPRWKWIEIEYDTLQKDKLVRTSERLSDFPARVAQHELDHLDGRLFIDYSLSLGLQVYSENAESEKLEVISPEMLVALGAKEI